MLRLRQWGIASIALAFLVPNHYLPWFSAYNELLAFLAVLLLGVSALAPWRPGLRATLPWSVPVVLLVGAIPFGQFAAGLLHFSGDAFVSFIYAAALSAAIAASFRLTSRHDSFAVELAWGILGAALVSSLLAMLQGLDQSPLGLWMIECPPDQRPYANLAQPNNLATLLGFGLASLLLLHERRLLGRLAAGLAGLVLCVGLGLTQSRIALVFGPVLIIGLLILRRRVPFRSSIIGVAAGTAIQWTVSLLWPAIQSALLLAPVALTLSDRGTHSVRFEMWPRLVDALLLRPWAGYGWLQVGEAQMATAEKYAPTGELWLQAHNLFLDLCLWVGAPLGAVLSLMVIWWGVTRWSRVSSIESACALFALTFFFLHAMVELPHHFAYFLIPVGLWMGVVEETAAPLRRQPAVLLAAGYGAALAIFIGIAAEYPRVEGEFRTVRFEVLGIGRPATAPPRFGTVFMSGVSSYINVLREDLRPAMTAESVDETIRVTQRFPYTAAMWRAAVALALNGRQRDAENVFLKLRHMQGEDAYRAARQRLHELRIEKYPELSDIDARLP